MLVVYRLFVVGRGFFGWVKLVFFVFRLVAVSSCLPVCLIWRSLGEWLVGELSGWIGLHVGRVSALGRWLGFPGTSLGAGWVGRRAVSRLIELHVGIVSALVVGWGALCPDAFRFACLGGCRVGVSRGISLDGLSYLQVLRSRVFGWVELFSDRFRCSCLGGRWVSGVV